MDELPMRHLERIEAEISVTARSGDAQF